MTPVMFTPARVELLANVLPETRAAELKLRAIAAAAGIRYDLGGKYAGLRTPADTAQLVKWRDDDVAAARSAAEAKRRKAGGTAVQIKLAGDAAANAAYYRVSPYNVGYHGIGGAFDIAIASTPKGMPTAEAYAYLGARAKDCGLTWGGGFKDNPATAIKESADPFHFELAQPRSTVEAKWRALAASTPIAKKGGSVLPVILVGLLLAGLAFAVGGPSRGNQ